MRVRVVLLLLLIGAAVGHSRDAAAEKVKTNQETKLYARPGEQAPVILTIEDGQGMTVLAREGRWIKVRVKGRTGYVPRSKVDEPEGEQVVRNTRRRAFVDGRSKERGFGGGEAPDDRVGADATGDGGDSTPPPSTTKPKPKPSGDDDDDGGKSKPAATKPKPAATKPKPGGDDDDDDGGKSKPAATKPRPATTKPKPSGDDDDDDGGKSKPAATKPKPAATKPKPSGDDDDDGGGKAKPGKAKPSGDDDDGGKAKPSGDDDDGKGGKDADSGDKPDVRKVAHVKAKTSILENPDANSDEAFVAHPKDKLLLGEVSGKWTFVETDDGDAGYVLSAKLDSKADPVLTGRLIQLDAGLGFTFLGQNIHTVGSTKLFPDNYTLNASTVTLALGGAVYYPYKQKYVLGVDLAYDYGKSVVSLGEGMNGSTGFTHHELNLRAMIGYDTRTKYGIVVYGRLGVHYEIFHVHSVEDLMNENTALVPSESYFAPTIGLAIDAVHLTPRIGAHISLDAVAFGSTVEQTKNLEDGSTPTGQSVFFHAGALYHFNAKTDFVALYELNYGSFDFGAPLSASERMHTGTDVQRTDNYHTLTFGVIRGF